MTGLSAIDRLSVFACAFKPTQMPVLESVPSELVDDWALIITQITDLFRDPQGDDRNSIRALKWWLFLPQVLLRRATHGGNSGQSAVRAGFARFQSGNFEELFSSYAKDAQYWLQKAGGHKDGLPIDRALRFISEGEISRATNLLLSHGLRSVDFGSAFQEAPASESAHPRLYI